MKHPTQDPATMSDAERYGRDIVEGLHELNAALEVYEGNDDRDPFGVWLDDALEVVTLRSADGDRHRVEVLVTVGGPRAEVVRDSLGGEMLEIAVYWWGDTWHGRAWLPRLAYLLDEVGQGER